MALPALPMGGSLTWSHRPMRGPNITAATRAPVPPTRLTPQLPATSTTPRLRRNPASDQSQQVGTQKTKVLKREKKM